MRLLNIYLYRRFVRREAILARTEPDTVRCHLENAFAEPDALRTVVLRDRVGGPWWLLGTYGPIRYLDISTRCPRCGEPRGVPRRRGRTDTWTNPCGHRDRTREVVTEADAIILGARRDAQLQRILARPSASEGANPHA
ncbi:hypothetical protein ACFXHA_43585 [Nocardia sp. NPDC059240]|uniref:hypothetical protein n=1 Tax=Nocardia sp. NPDC059240 TaxID=3346786 RepID=UPI0036BB72C6